MQKDNTQLETCPTDSSRDTWPVPAPGNEICSRYYLGTRLGQGAMGVVFVADDLRLAKRVAIKFVRTDRRGDEDYHQRLFKEACLCARLTHENVAQILDVSPGDAPYPYVVFEYVEGCTIAALLEEKSRVKLDDAIALIRGACSGLAEAHRVGVIHRDLKPANLIIRQRADGTQIVKIVDFGIARLDLPAAESQVTATDSTGGTPHYMAPEVVRGESKGDERSDVYAVGAILYELLSGEKAHPGSSKNAVLYHVATAPPVPIEKHVEGLPRPVVRLVQNALASDPKHRIPSAREFLRRLDEVTELASPAKRPEPSSRPGRRGLSIGIPLGVGLLVGLGVGASADARPTTGSESGSTDRREVVDRYRAEREPQDEAMLGALGNPFVEASSLVPPEPESPQPLDVTQPASAPEDRSPHPVTATGPWEAKRDETDSVNETPALIGFETENPYE